MTLKPFIKQGRKPLWAGAFQAGSEPVTCLLLNWYSSCGKNWSTPAGVPTRAALSVLWWFYPVVHLSPFLYSVLCLILPPPHHAQLQRARLACSLGGEVMHLGEAAENLLPGGAMNQSGQNQSSHLSASWWKLEADLCVGMLAGSRNG